MSSQHIYIDEKLLYGRIDDLSNNASLQVDKIWCKTVQPISILGLLMAFMCVSW